MRWLSHLALVLAFAALAVSFGVALNRSASTAVVANQSRATGEALGRKGPAAERAANANRDQIRAELQMLGTHAWAGEYYAGDGLGVNAVVLLAPKAGYVFEWHGCLGLYDRNYGSITEKDGKLSLSFTFDNSREGFRGIAPELFPVRWGKRRYLIPVDNVVGFCNQVNQGAEPRSGLHGLYFLRRGDEGAAVVGAPSVSSEFLDYLLLNPVEARISTVGESVVRTSKAGCKCKVSLLTIDAGKGRGLKVGMELVVTEPDNVVESVTITKVDDNRSEAVMSQLGEEQPGPKAGWRLSTRAPWHSITK